MGFFGLFKKKDEFDSLLKEPLADPFDKINPSIPQQNIQQSSHELPNFDMSNTPKNEFDMGDFPSALNPNNNATAANPMNFSQPQTSGYNQTFNHQRNVGPEVFEEMPPQNRQGLIKGAETLDRKDFEIINSKLDTVKSMLENLNHRLDNIEKKPYDEESPRKKRYNW